MFGLLHLLFINSSGCLLRELRVIVLFAHCVVFFYYYLQLWLQTLSFSLHLYFESFIFPRKEAKHTLNKVKA